MKTKAVHGLCILAAGLVAQSALASKAFVSTSGGNVSPYDSWEKAATTLEAVLSVKPDEVEIGDGTFTHTVAKHIIDWPCYIHSSNGPDKTTLVTKSKTEGGHFQVEAAAEGTLIAGLTLQNGYDISAVGFTAGWAYRRAPISLENGTISNCVIKGEFKQMQYCPILYLFGDGRAVDSDFQGDYRADSIPMDGSSSFVKLKDRAVVERCRIHGWKRPVACGNGPSYSHGAVHLISADAILRNSLVYDNQNGDSTHVNDSTSKVYYNGAGVFLDAGTVENCTVAGNVSGGQGGGIYGMANGIVRNCIVWGNVAYAAGGGQDIHSTATTAANITYTCAGDVGNTAVLPSGGGTGCTAENPQLGTRSGLYPLTPRSVACIDRGVATPASEAAGATDLVGDPRVFGSAVDMGCREFSTHELRKAFVSTSGGNVSPYDSWEKAATTLEAVLSVKPDEVEIGDGTFTHTVAKHIIDWPCYIHSSNGPDKTTLVTKSKTEGGHFQVEAAAEGTLIAGLTLQNGYDISAVGFTTGWLYRRAPISLENGTISNCVIKGEFKQMQYCSVLYLFGDGCAVDSDFQGDTRSDSTIAKDGKSPFVWLVDRAVVERCRIHGWKRPANCGQDADYSHGAVYLVSADAVLRNSLVYDNQNGSSTYVNDSANRKYYDGAGILLNAGTVENCTVVGNVSGGLGGGIYGMKNGIIRNCIVWGNVAYAAGGGQDIHSTATTAANITYTCAGDVGNTAVLPSGGGTGCLSLNPLLRNGKNAPYLLRANSPCRGVGDATVSSEWDLLGNPRKTDGHIDLGCYENTYKGLVLIVR